MKEINPLTQLSNENLLQKTERLASEERRITTEVLQCLREVEARMLYAELGFSSLYEFCVKYLRYSDGSAHRRISAMRLLKALPIETQNQTEEKIKDGTLTLTNLSLLHGFFKTEKKEEGKIYTDEQKSELLVGLEHQSKREVEKQLATIQPKILPQESERVISDKLTEIKFLADEELIKKLNRVREVSAHSEAGATYSLLFQRLADEYLKKYDPLMKSTSPARGRCVKKTTNDSHQNTGSAAINDDSRHIPSAIRQEIWMRDQGKCTYRHPKTKHSCNSKFGLEIDHIKPFAFGGKHEVSNLRLLCRTHNQHSSVKIFGPLKIA